MTSWSGAAEPRSAATGAGKPATSGTKSRPAGVKSCGISASSGSARIAAARTSSTFAARSRSATRPALGAPLALREDHDEGSRPVDGGQVAVQERLEVAVGGREPRSFLDLEDELAAGGPVTSEAITSSRVASAKRAAIPSAAAA